MQNEAIPKNSNIMKNKLSILNLLSIVLAAMFVGSPTFLHAQALPYNFAYANPESSAVYIPSIVRAYSPTLAVIFYDGRTSPGIGNSLVLSSIYGSFQKIKIPGNLTIFDMRILNNNVYLCGHDTISKQCFFAVVDINDFYSSSATLKYRFVKLPPPVPPATLSNATLWRMQVYKDQFGNTKLVALGHYYYNSSCLIAPPTTSPFCYNYLYTQLYFPNHHFFMEDFVLECTDPMGATSVDIKLVNSDYNNEHISDILLTPSYVAIIGQIFGTYTYSTATIHRCKKDNVLATFDNPYTFTVPAEEGTIEYKGCTVENDNIVMATTGCIDPSNDVNDLRIRKVNLQSMTMSPSQAVSNIMKTEPIDMTFLPKDHTLVLLAQMNFPTSQPAYQFTFLNLYPDKNSTYNAKGLVETRAPHNYESLNTLRDSCYIATGGNYGIVKDVLNDDPTPSCHFMDKTKVTILNDITIYPSIYPYEANSFLLDTITTYIDTPVQPALFDQCIDTNP